MTFAKTVPVPTPIVIGDPSEEDGTVKLTARVRGMKAGRTALCRDLMDIVAEIKEDSEQHVGVGGTSPLDASAAGGGAANAAPTTPTGNRSGSRSDNRSGTGGLTRTPARPKQSKVSVIIYTDTIPADGDIGPVLRALGALLTVHLVVRVCTADESVRAFWTAQQAKGDLAIDVLFDYLAEGRSYAARHARLHEEGWLVYGEPLHRLREVGLYGAVMGGGGGGGLFSHHLPGSSSSSSTSSPIRSTDAPPPHSDPAPTSLTVEDSTEIRKLCAFVLGVREAQLPIPLSNWSSFEFVVGILNRKEGNVVYDGCGGGGGGGGGGVGGGSGVGYRTWVDMGVLRRVHGPPPGDGGSRVSGGNSGSSGGGVGRAGVGVTSGGGGGTGNGRASCTVQ